eukprot:1144061-Pelagomonas_calceolata.AAC.1
MAVVLAVVQQPRGQVGADDSLDEQEKGRGGAGPLLVSTGCSGSAWCKCIPSLSKCTHLHSPAPKPARTHKLPATSYLQHALPGIQQTNTHSLDSANLQAHHSNVPINPTPTHYNSSRGAGSSNSSSSLASVAASRGGYAANDAVLCGLESGACFGLSAACCRTAIPKSARSDCPCDAFPVVVRKRINRWQGAPRRFVFLLSVPPPSSVIHNWTEFV